MRKFTVALAASAALAVSACVAATLASTSVAGTPAAASVTIGTRTLIHAPRNPREAARLSRHTRRPSRREQAAIRAIRQQLAKHPLRATGPVASAADAILFRGWWDQYPVWVDIHGVNTDYYGDQYLVYEWSICGPEGCYYTHFYNIYWENMANGHSYGWVGPFPDYSQ